MLEIQIGQAEIILKDMQSLDEQLLIKVIMKMVGMKRLSRGND